MVSLEEASRIASRFQIEHPISVELFPGRGNINLDTLIVASGPNGQRFLLQRINDQVFPMWDRVMAGMIASLDAQRGAIHPDLHWHVPGLVPTHSGEAFHFESGAWRMMQFIEGVVSYKSLEEVPSENRLEIAAEVGRGLAIYSDLTADIKVEGLRTALPGYRDTRLYYSQLDAALAGYHNLESAEHLLPKDEEVRATCQRHFYSTLLQEEWQDRHDDPELQPFIETALRYRPLAISLQEAREQGVVRTTAIHGDTKIENFLFDASTGKVVALVDLDTIMPLTWLADWGDMVRSLCNVAGEKESDLSRVEVDRDVYQAVMEGFLAAAKTATEAEIQFMPTAVQAITLELGVRFLSDYLRGDTYFALTEDDPADLNRTRAMVQIRLFEKLLEHEPEARQLLAQR